MYSAQRVQWMYMDHVLEKKMGSLLQYLMHNVMTTIGQQSFYLDAVLAQKYRINLPLCLSSPFMSLVSWNWRDWGIDHRTTADDVSWEWSIMNNNVVVQFTQIIAHLVQCIYTHVSCSGVLEKRKWCLYLVHYVMPDKNYWLTLVLFRWLKKNYRIHLPSLPTADNPIIQTFYFPEI